MSRSELEQTFAAYARMFSLPDWAEEYRFAQEAMGRRWRFDFAWPEQQVAVEVEGGTYARGRHTRGSGYAADCEKYNAAQLLGWRVMRYTGDMLKNNPAGVMEQVKQVLGEASDGDI